MREKRVSLIVVSLLAMLTLMFSIQPITRAQKEKIKIGVAQPMTGPLAPTAAVHHAYYDMIVQDYNAKGGIYVPEYGKRLPIEFIKYDDEYNLDKCYTLYEKLITQDQVDFLFSPWSTTFCFAMFPLFEQYKYPVVGLTVGSDIMSEKLRTGEYKYTFLTLGVPWEDAIEVSDVISYINEKIASPDQQISRIGITYRADEHGIEHAEALKKGFTAKGWEVPVYESYIPIPPPADWTPIITKLSEAHVDVAIICSYDEGATFVHQCITQNYNPKLMFTGPAMETSFLVYGPFGFTPGDVAGIAYYNGFPSTNYTTPGLKEWAENHTKRLGYLPFPASYSFYAGLDCYFKAVEKYGLDREKVRDAMATETFDTVAGKFKFRVGQSPEVEGCGTITQWEGGEMMEVVWPRNATSTKIIYPKFPWSWAKVLTDLPPRDGKVNILDITVVAKAYGTKKGDPKYNPIADLDGNEKITILDITKVARDYGKKAFP